jgi:hypothetical protein
MQEKIAEDVRWFEPAVGTRSTQDVSRDSGVIDRFVDEPLVIERADIMVVHYEVAAAQKLDLLPPALHGTSPVVISWVFQHVKESEVGSFNSAQMRINCRSSLRPRTYIVKSFIDNASAGLQLEARSGYAFATADIHLDFGYAASDARVELDGTSILHVSATAPVLLHSEDVFWSAEMVPARTPLGLRLVQNERSFDIQQAERLVPTVRLFEAAAWTDPPVRLVHPISAARITGATTFRPIRFVCDPNVVAADGTESVAAHSDGALVAQRAQD